jgi:ABC-type phosphate transport system substrate-binding protein
MTIMSKRTTVSLRLLAAAAALVAASIAHAGDVVVIMASGAAPLTKDQVAGIYLGRNKDLKPFDLPDANPLRAAFYKLATGRDLAQVKAAWSRLQFTGQGWPPKEVTDVAAMKKLVAADPKAIGYIEKADVDSSVKVVATLN